MLLPPSCRPVLRLVGALAASLVVGFVWPILWTNLAAPLGGTYMTDRFLHQQTVAAVVLAVLTQLALSGSRRLCTILAHLVGLTCGLLFPLLLDTRWLRIARERAESVSGGVPGLMRVETAFIVIWLSAAVAVGSSFILSVVMLVRSKAGTHKGSPVVGA